MTKQETTVYEFPDGFRRLSGDEYLRNGDLAWNEKTKRFEVIFNTRDRRYTASQLICVIRKVENV